MHTLRSLPNPSASDTPAYPRDERAFYAELVTRNRHFVPAEAQAKMRDLKVLVAGCGSGGGACIEPLARLGVTKFMIADNGAYELANLNRQHAFVDSIGVNKAEFHANELRRINPFIQVEAFTEGVTRENLDRMIGWADIIFDCVDVTTYDAIVLKLLLHEKAHAAKRPVFSMLDLGYCQWGESYDYRTGKVAPLNGRLEKARKHTNPIKIFMNMFPLKVFPAHSLQLVLDLLENPKTLASQLGCASDLLASVVPPAIVRFCKDGTVVEGWNINLENLGMTPAERLRERLGAPRKRAKIRQMIK